MNTGENITTSQQALQEHLTLLKSKGYSRRKSLEILKAEMYDASSPVSTSIKVMSGVETPHAYHNKVIKPGDLGKVYKAVFSDDEGGLTPLELAQDAKLFYENADDVALAVKSGFPELSATDVARLLLDPTVYPGLSSNDMRHALQYAGFNDQDINTAISALYKTKTTVNVDARQKWQDTGVKVDPGERVTIVYKSGTWTANPATGYVNADGNRTYIAKAGYTLQGAREGALIGKVAEQAFLVGNSGAVPSGLTGKLYLCINDDLSMRYGDGFSDNRGTITVEIEEKK
jgi:hypothetical protein